jgi:ATP-dependent Zn protease
MEFIYSFELTQRTLIFTFILPFLFFGYNQKYWYRPDLIARYNFFLSSVCVLLALAIGLNLFHGQDNLSVTGYFELALLHMAVLVLTLMILNWKRPIGLAGAAARGKNKEKPVNEAGYDDYRPIPLNNEVQRLSWEELIIDASLREELISVIELLKDPRTAHKYGINVPKGILLSGPPGTGKTTIAKVIASTANLSFFVLKMDEVVSKWIGDSEKNLSKLFQAASKHAPSIIFIDEVDSIGRNRSGGQQWSENLLNHLLQLIDGVINAEGLYLVAATNRPDLVDTALKRAGRLSKIIEVPLPDFEARMRLFSLYLSRLTLEESIDLQTLAKITAGKSGADIKEVCNQAGLNAFKREAGSKRKEYVVTTSDLERALSEFLGKKEALASYS